MRDSRFTYTPLSEARVVREQILKRSECDESYLPGLFQGNLLDTEGVFPLDEDVVCTYIDLDMLIETCGLSQTEKLIVSYLMQGYGLSDIAEYLGHARQTSNEMFDRAVEKITAENNRRWEACHSDKPYSAL